MKKFIKKTVSIIQIAIVAGLFAYAGMIYVNGNENNDSLKQEIVILNAQIDEQKEGYEETILKIVESVKMTDSYLFTGGFNAEEAEAFGIKEYEQMLTLKNDFTELLEDVNNFFDDRTEYLDGLPNTWPLKSIHKIVVSSGFGDRFSPITGKIYMHEGIDFVTEYGDPVLATADGVVTHNWIQHWIMGKWVIIKHKNGIETHYAHMSKVIVHEGNYVKKGQIIGYLGDTGVSTGPHLHYAIKQDGVFKNPILFLRNPPSEEQ